MTTGAPITLTDEIAETICGWIRQGHYRTVAVAFAKVPYSTFTRWMAAEGEPYATFQGLIKAAEAEAENAQLAKIVNSPEPVDAKWYLARKFPERWAETKRVDITGRIDMGIKLSNEALTDASAREHIIGLTEYLFREDEQESADDPTGDGEPYGPSEDHH